MTGQFTAQLDEWVEETQGALELVFQGSTERLIEKTRIPKARGGNMPVDTGFLRASLQVKIGFPATGATFNPGGKSFPPTGEYVTVINTAKLGQTIFATYTANYAGYVEFGANGRPGARFVGLAVQQWQAIVNQVTAELKQS